MGKSVKKRKKENQIQMKLRASDFKAWGFCPKQWWFQRITGKKPSGKEVAHGIETHRTIAEKVEGVRKLQSVFIIGVVIWLLILLSYFL